MITALLSLLGSSAIGSLIGGVFAFLNRKTDIVAKQIELAHEKDRWAHELAVRESDLAIAREEAKAKLDVAVIEGDATVDAARMGAIAAIAQAERLDGAELQHAGWWGFLLVWANVLNKMIRPVLTVGLIGAALYVNWLVIDMLTRDWPSLTNPQRFESGMQAMSWITAQASVVIAYWFVSRGSSGGMVSTRGRT